MTTNRILTSVLISSAMAFIGCAGMEPQTDGKSETLTTHSSMVFHCPDDARDSSSVTALVTVEKPGKTRVEAKVHFPKGFPASASDVVIQVSFQLRRAGWTSPQDYLLSDGCIHFYGISKIGAGIKAGVMVVNGATDNPAIPFRVLTPEIDD